MRTNGLPYCLLLALTGLLPPPPADAQSESGATYTPRFEEAPCPFDVTPQMFEQVRCGWLTVPQNRAEPNGKQLRLAVAILESTSPTPRPDPIVFLHNAPGDRSVASVSARARGGFWSGLRRERDIVFYDQRGTGFSEPEFCSEITDEYVRALLLGLNAQQRSEHLVPVLARCAEVMRGRGVELAQFNNVASALDLEDLRRALGYQTWNLFGAGNGSRIGLEAMRTAPKGIRSAVFDGPVPPNAMRLDDTFAKFADVVHRLSAACAADSACNATYPDLEERVWRTIEALYAAPWLIRGGSRTGLPDPLVLDGSLFATTLNAAFALREFLALVPLFVEEVDRRNTAMVLALYGGLTQSVRAISRGANLAVLCSEGGYSEVLDERDNAAQAATQALCDAWQPYRAGPELAQPVQSDIPTLAFTGEFAPVSHRSYGPLTVQGLANGHLVEVPGMGQGASLHHPCTRAMVRAFFDDPARAPDRSCITEEMAPLRFVTDARVAPKVSHLVGTLGSPNPPKLLPAALGLPLLVLLGSTVGWPLAAGVGRLRRRERVVRSPLERRARWGAIGFTLLALSFAAALAWVVAQTAAENPLILLFGLPGWAAPLLWVPWLLVAGSMALASTAALAWRRGAWTRWGRIHFTLVSLASLALATTLLALGWV
jgi:pimeloyl-ACP methyl ester carboxylesterase